MILPLVKSVIYLDLKEHIIADIAIIVFWIWIIIALLLINALGSSLYVCYNYYPELSLYSLIKYALLSIATFLGSATLYFYLLFQAYLCFSNLTTLEFIYPKLRLKNRHINE